MDHTPTDGFFYVGQPIPKHNPNRLKAGHTTNLKRRSRDFRCASPDFVWLKTYPATKKLETRMLTRLRVKFSFIGKEVMEVQNYQDVVDACDEFFEGFLNLAVQ